MSGYHRPYPLCYDYLKTPNGWWVPDFYEFSDEDDKTTMEHISIYFSQLGFDGKEDYMRVRNFPLSLTGIANMVYIFAAMYYWFMVLIRGAIL